MLLRRTGQAAFAPGKYVFPGGRVDATDASRAGLEVVDGLTERGAAQRLELASGDPPAIAYYLAALRETFEETGILLGIREDGSSPPSAAEDVSVARMRGALMEGRIGFADVLRRMRCRLPAGELCYFGHWITPHSYPRRFDTRFFATEVPHGTVPTVDEREMDEALWITPAIALKWHADGKLPMIRPTLWALEQLRPWSVSDALQALAERPVHTVLPSH